ncbi:MAG: hypothetical protein JSV85_01850 [Candidatus Bathyarchaeota archaeon]|nr:MAG: hypothetical protein JSV85_01850 [Candidatus Bathyarchaeota archaeon]
MDLKKSAAKKGSYGPQGSRPFGIAGKVTSTNPMGKTEVDVTYPPNYRIRKPALRSVLRAECWKAQAITLVRRNYYV